MALKNIAEILTIASFGLKSVYKINEDSSSDSAPTKMKSSPALAPKRNTQLESEQGPIPRPPKPSKQ